jgi:oxygen-independent coproporphyrinogen-3 oxidase
MEFPSVGRLLRDLVDWGRLLDRPSLDTLYIGGGTPSLLSREHLEAIGLAICTEFDASGMLEATLEANPGTLDSAWLGAARRGGWDRISLGVQSLDDGVLRLLGRPHDGAQGIASIRKCREAGFGRIGADLLLGAPGQSAARILDDARRLVDAGVEHLSAYMLDLDKPCRMKTLVEAGHLELPSEDEVADAYLALQDYLLGLGLVQYEISNFSLPGRHSVHNLRYWQRRPYVGIGPGAAGNVGDLRWTECENVSDWAEGSKATEVHRLAPSDVLAEVPLLGLRMREGVDWAALSRSAEVQGLAGLVEEWERELVPLAGVGLVERDGDRLRLTQRGMLLGNQVFRVFVA